MRFGEYEDQADEWITIFEAPFYPDILEPATVRFGPILEGFRRLVVEAADSSDLLRRIQREDQPLRGQLLRVFRWYISPDTPVERLKIQSRTEGTIRAYGNRFRPLAVVAAKLQDRPDSDEALAALLAVQGDRGGKGYDLTETFFNWAEAKLPDGYSIIGPRRAGSDVILSDVLPDFDDAIPADFVVFRGTTPVAVGFAHYDSDRGGAQEDDRIGGNREKAAKLLRYAAETGLPLKILFVNDGPGLPLGSMWRDYAALERLGADDEVRVCTLKMLDARSVDAWLAS